MREILFGVWNDEEQQWHYCETLEEAVFHFPEKTIYKIQATPVGKFKLKSTLVEVKE